MDIQAHHYYAAKRADQTQGKAGLQAEPRWLKTLPQVYNVTAAFNRLIDQLPTVRATHNDTVTKTYFKQLVAELVKIYAYRLRMVELSDTIPEQDKSATINHLVTECRQYISDLAELVSYDPNRPAVS